MFSVRALRIQSRFPGKVAKKGLEITVRDVVGDHEGVWLLLFYFFFLLLFTSSDGCLMRRNGS